MLSWLVRGLICRACGNWWTVAFSSAAMRMLALARAKVRAGSATILTLFDAGPAAPPAELTDFDRGYLRGLYSGAANERGILKVERIARDRRPTDDRLKALKPLPGRVGILSWVARCKV